MCTKQSRPEAASQAKSILIFPEQIREELFSRLSAVGAAPRSQSDLVADGTLHRHHIAGDAPASRNGWHVLHLDPPPAGAGGDWRTGARVTWCAKSQQSLTAKERDELRRRVNHERAERLIAEYRQHREAAARALELWHKAKPANPSHGYLQRKKIAPGVARQSGRSLVLPVLTLKGELASLQFIDERGGKRFLSGARKRGCYIPTNSKPDGSKRLICCEGWATGQSLAELMPDSVVLACGDCGNLEPVALECRRLWPSAELVVAPDFDSVGMEKGRAAAVAARAQILPIPKLPQDFTGTDWNDWANYRRGVSHVA